MKLSIHTLQRAVPYRTIPPSLVATVERPICPRIGESIAVYAWDCDGYTASDSGAAERRFLVARVEHPADVDAAIVLRVDEVSP